MIPLLEPIVASLGTTNMLLPLVLNDLSDETARQRTRDGEGPSIAWEVGHLLDFRYQMLASLGAEKERPFAIDFIQTPASDGQDYPTLSELREVWDQLRAELEAALDAATERSIRQLMPKGGPHGEQAVLGWVVFLAWHEAYHMGAIGAIRKGLGLPGPAELVMAQSAS